MSDKFPVVYLARHSETAWSRSGQHTGLTDLLLTEHGEQSARRLGNRLVAERFDLVLTSGLQRADRTCELAGFGAQAVVNRDLVEWDYGEYEGMRTDEIQSKRPDWQLFRDGCPAGESLGQVSARADRVLAIVRQCQGDTLLFSSGHFIRVLAARWLGQPPLAAQYFVLNAASLSILGYDHSQAEPVIRLWNDISHLGP